MRPHPLAAALTLAMIAVMAHAGRSFGQDAQKLPPTYTLTVDQADLAALDRAIQEIPKRIADPLIAKLDAQIRAQIAELNKPAEKPKD